MRRITLTVVTTLAILVLLFSYRTSRNQAVTASTVASPRVVSGGPASVVSSSAGPDPSGDTAAEAITIPSRSASPSAVSSTTTAPTTAPATRTTGAPPKTNGKSATAAPSTSTSSLTTTVDGAAVGTRYGDVQVEVRITAGKITDVQALQYPNQERRDQEINADALPQLRSQVLSAQSADIAGVSGATFTTEGYLGSLQSALDQVHFR